MKNLPEGFYPIPKMDSYGINKLGQVYSLKTDRLLNQKTFSHNGHPTLAMIYEGCAKAFTIASLMIRTFIVSPLSCKSFQIVHLDGNKLNNSLDNLDVRDNHRRRK